MTLRLTDPVPHWISFAGWVAPEPFYYGVSFLCPGCERGECPTCGSKRGHRVAVSFWPPIDPGNYVGRISLPDKSVLDTYHRRVDGDTWDTLTLSPSVGLAHWHGHIIAGKLSP